MTYTTTRCTVLLVIGVLLPQLYAIQDVLFVSTKRVLRYFQLTDLDNRGTVIHVKQIQDAVAVDYDPFEGYVYWADQALSIVARAKLDGSDEQVIVNTLATPSGLALDVESRMMYWTEKDNASIWRSYLNGTGKEMLLEESMVEPSAIQLDTRNGKMYWFDTSPIQRIEQANLDGTERNTILRSSSQDYLAFTLDVDNKRVYWVDNDNDKLMYSDLHGNDATELLSNSFDTLSLAVYGNTAYWHNIIDDVHKIEIFDMDSLTHSPFVQLPYWGLYCLKADKGVLLVCQRQGLMEIDTSLVHDLGKQIEGFKHFHITGLDYTTSDDKIYWIDRGSKKIKASARNGSDIEELADTKALIRTTLAVSMSRVFWPEKKKSHISSVLKDGGDFFLLNNLENVMAVAVNNKDDLIYWILNDSFDGKIQRADFHGNSKTTLMRGLRTPTALVLDVDEGQMYYTEYYVPVINIANMEGEKLGSLPARIEILYLAVSGDYVYWYSHNPTKVIGKTNRKKYNGRMVILTKQEVEFRSIRLFHDVKRCSDVDCKNGGSCSDMDVGYNCSCVGGFTGWNCDINIDECEGVICQNNGTCVDQINGYNCTCKPGFVGDQCETVISACASNPCQNGGKCIDDVSGYSCVCRLGYYGDHCDTGLGFLVVIIVVITISVTIVYLTRRAMYRSRQKSHLTSQGRGSVFSIVHLPAPAHSQMYRMNEIIMRSPQLSQ